MKKNILHAIMIGGLTLASQHIHSMASYQAPFSTIIEKNWKAIGASLATVATAHFINRKLASYLAEKPVKPTPQSSCEAPKYPIVYDPQYNISLFGALDKYIHPFDGEKYGKVARYLQDKGLTKTFHPPITITNEVLQETHSKEYLDSTLSSWNIAGQVMAVFPLTLAPNWFLQWRVLRPMKSAVGGTLRALELALSHGYAFNIGAGYHHAQNKSYPKIGGYCVFADIQLAVKRFHNGNPQGKVLIVDLDAHQGNGYEHDLGADRNVAFFDVYNQNDYPGWDDGKNAPWEIFSNDYSARFGEWLKNLTKIAEPNRRYIQYNQPINSTTTQEQYLNIVRNNLKTAIEQFKPDLIIYNAGTDILKGDPEGKLNIDEAGIIERDALVFTHAFEQQVPIMMLTSGGYTRQSAGIIGKSIENILRNIRPNFNHLKDIIDQAA